MVHLPTTEGEARSGTDLKAIDAPALTPSLLDVCGFQSLRFSLLQDFFNLSQWLLKTGIADPIS